MRRLGILLACQVALAGVALPVARAQEPRGRYIVVLRSGADSAATAESHGKKYGTETRAVYRHALTGYSAFVPESRLEALRSDPSVRSVTPERTFRATAQTTPTGVSRIRAPATLNKGAGVHVAVMDTGIDLEHPDLAANIAGGKNCSTGTTYDDGNGHGSHVAGIIAALDNTIGVRGVAPQAKLWAVRVLNNAGSGDLTSILCGLDFIDTKSPARGGPITIANMSLEAVGGDSSCGADPFHQAICTLDQHGVTVVAAAGNSHSDLASVQPATYSEVITVSAFEDWDGKPCGLDPPDDDVFAISFSNYATQSLDRAHLLGAPGVNILSTVPVGTGPQGGDYEAMHGTSMASPHVAGAAALYIAEHPGATRTQVLADLKAAAEPVNVNFKGECTSGVSHTDPSALHPEPVVAVARSVFVVVPPGIATSPIGAQFAGAVDGIDDQNLVLRLASGGGNVPATVTYDAGTHRATIQPLSPLVPGEYYQVIVAPDGSTPPTDENGNPLTTSAASFRAGVMEQEYSAVARYYWRQISASGAHGGLQVTDRTRGATESFSFTGSQVSWYTMRGPDQGKAHVYIDGAFRGTFDLYRSAPQYRYRLSWSLPSGQHTIKILVLGTKSSRSTNAWVTVDAFSVGGTLYANPGLVAGWRTQSSTVAWGNTYALDGVYGTSVLFRFRGTGIDWRTILGPDQGLARVTIDGVYKGQFDNYASSTRGYTRAFRGLADRVHEIRISVMGQKRAASSATNVSVDFWRAI